MQRISESANLKEYITFAVNSLKLKRDRDVLSINRNQRASKATSKEQHNRDPQQPAKKLCKYYQKDPNTAISEATTQQRPIRQQKHTSSSLLYGPQK